MGQSKLELAVGTGQWDAGLKKAQQALNSFTQAQGGLQQALAKDNGDMQKFIQMMGKMDSTANTSKGQMNDYKRVLEQLTAQYNQMSDAQKKSIGQDYLQTIDALKQKFAQAKQQVDDFNRSLGETSNAKLSDISGGGGGLFSGGKFGGMLQVFGGNMMTKAAGLAASFASELGDAVSQGIELARAGEGIRIAFERLGRGDILDGLREATHGTVTDLELMKAAVKFNDFKLPLEELGTMLAFAQQKAKDTGQSVDYMVDSIVTGLGRKSLMILDNLGLSAAEIKEKMAETGDMTKAVGAIIREQMAKAGDYVETAADRAAQANVNLQNKMEELGRKFGPLQEASNNLWTSMKIGIMDIVGGPLTNFLNKLTEAGRLANAYGVLGGNGKVGRMIANLSGTSDGYRQSIYQQQQQKFWQYINPREQQIKDIRAWQRGERGDALQSRINAIIEKYGSLDATKIQAEVDAAKKMLADYQQAAKTILNPVKADIDTSGAENNVDSLKKKLKDLDEQRKKAIKAGDTELAKNLTKQINQTKTDIRGLDPSALKTTGANNTPKTEEQLNNKQIQKLTQEYIKATDERRKAIEAEIKGLQQRNDEIKKLTDIAQGKVAPEGSLNALNEKLKELQTERGKLIDPIEIEIQDQQIKKVQDEIDRLNGKKVDVELEVNNLSSFEQLQQSLRIKIAEKNMEVDTNTLQTLMQTAIKNGIESLNPDFASLQEKMREGMNIPDDTWQALQDQINAKLKELGIDPIQIELKTGGIKNISQEAKTAATEFSKAASAIGSVGSALQSIEDPGAKVAGIIAQAIATIAQTFAASLKGTFTPWDWIAGAAAGTATMISTIAAIKSATASERHAGGGFIGGKSYSGDNVMMPIEGGGMAALSSGELVLNRAQQSNLATQLEGGAGRNVHVTGHLEGETIVLAADRYGRRTGKGELAFWK